MKTREDPRHHARIVALQYLFSIHFATEINPPDTQPTAPTAETLDETATASDINQYDRDLALRIIAGVEAKMPEINTTITTYAPQWPIDQIQKVDLEILRIALWEGFFSETTPPKVAIDEAIEVAKEFGGDTSAKFVNGVLGTLYEKKK